MRGAERNVPVVQQTGEVAGVSYHEDFVKERCITAGI